MDLHLCLQLDLNKVIAQKELMIEGIIKNEKKDCSDTPSHVNPPRDCGYYFTTRMGNPKEI